MMVRSDRPTTPPSFDLDRYARDSDAYVAQLRPLPSFDGLGAPAATEPHSETRMATRPPIAMTDEAWARSMTGAPAVAMLPGELRQMPLDHRAGFLLSLMDGSLDLEAIVDVSAMRREDALRILRDLYESGVVVFR